MWSRASYFHSNWNVLFELQFEYCPSRACVAEERTVTCGGGGTRDNNYGVCSDDWIYWCFFTVTLSYNQYSAIAGLHTLKFTVAHALGFSVSISRILATDFHTGIFISNHY
jgi:hypothetical protein